MQTTEGRAGRVRVEQGAKRVRAYLGARWWPTPSGPAWSGSPPYPAYYFPVEDVRTELPVPTATVTHSPSRGDAQHFTVKAGDRSAADAALRYVDSPIAELRGLVRLDWDAMDGWFEEDEEVHTHPRDPYTRVDILASSRRVRVEVDGVVLAASANARVLFETGLPLQGRGRVLVGPGRRPPGRGPGLVLSHDPAREPEDRRAGRLLQRGGRPVRRRPPPGAAGHQVQPSQGAPRRVDRRAEHGLTFQDPDGFRVVLVPEPWAEVTPARGA